MLRIYAGNGSQLVSADPEAEALWFDLVSPTSQELQLVEARLGIALPTPAEMAEIELSDRLYHEDGAAFMTMTAVHGTETEDPVKAPVTFVLKGGALVTVRHVEPKAFGIYVTRALKGSASPCGTGELVMLGIIEAIIDRTADALERIGDEIDSISRDVFRNKSGSATKKTRDLQSLIERIGSKGDLLSKLQDSLVSVSRLIAYHAALDRRMDKEGRPRIKLIQRDAVALGDHAVSLSAKITFLLDATLGLINLEQSQIIKIFSVAAVVFLPPTLVASIYGMNFEYMPELKWLVGYPGALGLMVASAIVPYLYFKRRGWL